MNALKKPYEAKLEAMQQKEWPYCLPAEIGIDDLSKWPNIEYPDIKDYLINTPSNKNDFMITEFAKVIYDF